MYDILVLVEPKTNTSLLYHFNDDRNLGVQSIDAPSNMKWQHDGTIDWRSAILYQCNKAGLPLLIETLSKEWVGHEIKVFNLAEIFSRIPGEVKRKKISEDGVLPT